MVDVAALLRQLEHEAAGLGDVARGNLARDLTAVVARARSGEYQETDFLVRSVFEVPRRTHEYVTYLRGWNTQAARWAALLRAVGVPPVVVDLCPGWAPKIELALHQLDYAGTVHVVDRSAASLAVLQDFLAVVRPRFTVRPVVRDVMTGDAPARGGLVVANHVVDDLLLDRWATRHGTSTVDLYEDEDLLRAAWRGVVKDGPGLRASFPRELARGLAAFVDVDGTLVTTHYASLVERLLGGEAAGALFADVFAALRVALMEEGLRPLPLPAHDDGFSDDVAALFTRPA